MRLWLLCNQRFYLLAQLKLQGLDLPALHSVFNAIVVRKILCALPVYLRYLTQGHKEMLHLQRVFKTTTPTAEASRCTNMTYEYQLLLMKASDRGRNVTF